VIWETRKKSRLAYKLKVRREVQKKRWELRRGSSKKSDSGQGEALKKSLVQKNKRKGRRQWLG